MGQIPTPVQAKRRSSRVPNIKARHQAGLDVSHERATVRVGKMNTQILIGAEDLSVWSDEELVRGQRKDKNGRYQGRPPKVVPKALHDELVRRTLSKANELMRTNLEDAVAMLVAIATGADVDDKDKLKAIEMMMNRVMGREPVTLEADIKVTTFDEVFESIKIKRGDIIDVESSDADDDD